MYCHPNSASAISAMSPELNCMMQLSPTRFPCVANILELGIENGFLKHSQEDNSTNPELDPQEISPVTGWPRKPQNPEEYVHNTHHHEKLLHKKKKEIGTSDPEK